MLENVFFRIPDVKSERLGGTLDTDMAEPHVNVTRLLDIMPVFNTIMPFWKETHLQLDTVFMSLQQLPTLIQSIDIAEKRDKTHINARNINASEEISIVSIRELKELLESYEKYQKFKNLVLNTYDLHLIMECFLEYVRKMEFPDKGSRLGALMMYENLGVAVQFNKMYNPDNNAKLCEVTIEEERSLDRYDASWLQQLTPVNIYTDYYNAIKSYWSGKISENRKLEWLFCGKYSLKEI